MLLPVGEAHVDLLHHLDHHARDIFLGVLVAIELSLHMAIGAHHTQAGRETAHHLPDVHVSWQHFEILGRTAASATAAATFAGWRLTAEGDHGKHSES